MKYMGSKNRISKHLKPIIESYLVDKKTYIEPFVGGANMIDKINFNNKIGSDLNGYVIELLKVAQNNIELIPDEITEEEYNKVKNDKYSFDRDKFINFLLELDESNVILVSEYDMPEDNFTKIWEKEVKVSISQTKKATEKLFILDKRTSK